MRDFRKHSRLLFETRDDTAARNLTINFFSYDVTTKILCSSRIVYCDYCNVSICSPEARHESFKVGNEETVIHFTLLRLGAYLRRNRYPRTSPVAQQPLYLTRFKLQLLNHSAMWYFTDPLFDVSVWFSVVKWLQYFRYSSNLSTVTPYNRSRVVLSA